jgi:3alpha(or 20beta)-hydroxysteroid dehydrogenase
MPGEAGRIAGKVAIVTGGARGVGAETARLFVRQGARVVIADIREEQGRALAGELGEAAIFCQADVGVAADWGRLVAAAHGFGPVSILVNNAAILKMASLADTSAEMFEALFRVNQLGPLLGIKAVMGDRISGCRPMAPPNGRCGGLPKWRLLSWAGMACGSIACTRTGAIRR